MKKGLTELIFILDRSGSMGGLEQDTIGGFNAMLRRQKAQEGEANITTVLFDNQYEKIHDRVPLERVKELTDQAIRNTLCGAVRHCWTPWGEPSMRWPSFSGLFPGRRRRRR